MRSAAAKGPQSFLRQIPEWPQRVVDEEVLGRRILLVAVGLRV